MDNNLISVGKIVKTHGIKGKLKVLVLSDIPERLKKGISIYSVMDKKIENLTLSYCRINKTSAIIKFKGIDTISSAKRLIDSTLCIREQQLASLPKNTYYIHNLVGLEVYDRSGDHIGELKEVWQLPANDVFVVDDKESNKEILFPATEEAIVSICKEKSEVVVDRNLGVT